MTVVSLRAIAPALTAFVSGLHHVRADDVRLPELERIVPGGNAHLLVNLDEDEYRIDEGPASRPVG